MNFCSYRKKLYCQFQRLRSFIYGSCAIEVFKFLITYTCMPLFICRQRQELLALSAYLGALLAIRRKYTPIIHPLFKHARCGDKTLLNCFPLLRKRFFLPASEKQAEWENNFFSQTFLLLLRQYTREQEKLHICTA